MKLYFYADIRIVNEREGPNLITLEEAEGYIERAVQRGEAKGLPVMATIYLQAHNAGEKDFWHKVDETHPEGMREAQARAQPPPLPPPAVAAAGADDAGEELYEAIRDAEAVIDAAIELGVTTDAMYPCQQNLEKLLKENGQWQN